MASLKDASAIVGIAETPFAKRLDGSERTLAADVIIRACADAGIDPSEIDVAEVYGDLLAVSPPLPKLHYLFRHPSLHHLYGWYMDAIWRVSRRRRRLGEFQEEACGGAIFWAI